MRNIFLTLTAIAGLLLTSCGGNSEKKVGEVTIKPKSTTLKGDLKDYFEVVDKAYKIKVEEGSFMNSGMITVEVKRTDKDFNFPADNINPFGTNGSEDYHVGFGIEIFDESDPVIVSNATSGGIRGPYSSDDVISLMKLGKGETGFIRWSVDGDKLKDLISFQLSSALEKSSNLGISSTSSTSISSKNNEDWDAYLKSYEGFIDQYIKLMKKAQSGDMSAMMEYAEYMEKATDLQKKMENAKSDLSATQMAKFMKLQTKLMNAVSQLQ